MTLDDIGRIFGPRILQVVSVVTATYYGLLALARIKELYFDGIATRFPRAQRSHLENLKLEAEIAAFRKIAGLPMLTTAELTPPPPAPRTSPAKRGAAALWSRGSAGRFFFVVLTIIFQLFGWLAVLLLIFATRYWLTNRVDNSRFHFTSAETYAVVAALLLGSGALYLGFEVFGRLLREKALLKYRMVYSGVIVLAIALFFLLWFQQKAHS